MPVRSRGLLQGIFKSMLVVYLICWLFVSQDVRAGKRPDKINVLFIISDDLRADISPYSDTYASHTPTLQKFAETSMVFEKAYTQQSVCGPARNSFLTGRRPDTLRSWNFLNSARKFSSRLQTIPQTFKQGGYETLSVGKVFHVYDDIREDAAKSWDTVYLSPGTGDDDKNCPRESMWCSCDAKDCADALIAQTVVNLLNAKKRQAESAKPWFIGVGFRRPHPDFVVDAKFPSFDEFPIQTATVQTPANFGQVQASGMPTAAFYSCHGLLSRWQFRDEPLLPWTPVNQTTAMRVRAAYYRSAAYMDSQLKVVLDALEASPFASNTLVVFTSDHGWSLGERAMWCKQSLFEPVARVPLMIRVPWLWDTSYGRRTSTVVELIDLFPTLVNLVGPTAPKLSINECAEGKDLTPVFKNKDFTSEANADDLGGIDVNKDYDNSLASFAVTQYPRCIDSSLVNPWSNPCTSTNAFTLMGYSLRTNRWRYTEWRVWKGNIADWTPAGLNATELYDHSSEVFGNLDFDATENENLVSQSPHLVARLSAALRHVIMGTRNTRPDSCLPASPGSFAPTSFPSATPTTLPSRSPSLSPTVTTASPTTPQPTPKTTKPTIRPTSFPAATRSPTPVTSSPSDFPDSLSPSISPSAKPSDTASEPSVQPTFQPTTVATEFSPGPTKSPTMKQPITMSPTATPSTAVPTLQPNTNTWSPSTPQRTISPSQSPQSNDTTSYMCLNDPVAYCDNSDWTCGVKQMCGIKQIPVDCSCWSFDSAQIDLVANEFETPVESESSRIYAASITPISLAMVLILIME